MGLFTFDIGEKAETVALFVGKVRSELQRALVYEKGAQKLTQQQLAQMLGVNRSVINRQIMGYENLTIRRLAELAWALGWEIEFSLRKPVSVGGTKTAPRAEAFAAAQPRTSNDNHRPIVVAA